MPMELQGFDNLKDDLTNMASNLEFGAGVNRALQEGAKPIEEQIRWFCLLFGNQFSPDDVLDGYPVDRLMHDIALALMAVQTQTTEILSQFPTKAAKEPATTQTEAESEEIPLF